jgi:PAS domain S-box-containing protein
MPELVRHLTLADPHHRPLSYPSLPFFSPGQYGSLSFAGLILLIMTFGNYQDTGASGALTNTLFIGLVPMWLLFSLLSYLRYRLNFRKVVALFKSAPAGTSPREIYRWANVQEVEMCARVCRTLDKDDGGWHEKYDQASVRAAEKMMKGGLSFFGSEAEMALLYASFMIDVMKTMQSGHSQLVAAKNLKPNFSQQFAIFCREQAHIQASQTAASGESSVDLVSYVEFQKNQRMLVRSHRAALLTTRDFWKLLMADNIEFRALSRALNSIEDSRTSADKAYKTMLERYSSSSKVLRMYAHFLEEVKNDPWAAAEYLEESEKLEEQAAAAESSLIIGDGDAKTSPVCIINAQGVIQMTNKLLLQSFGYKRGELDGKNVSCLMPQPFSGRHNTYLRNYITTGKGKIIDSFREVLGLHKDKYVFPTRVLVTKVSGEGVDSVFMGLFKPVAEDLGLVRCYVTPGGAVLCSDHRFYDWFGRPPSEIQGKPFHHLGVDQGPLEALVSHAAETSEDDLNAGKVKALGALLLHRFAKPVLCDIVLQLGGTENNRILIYNIRRKAESSAEHMMVTDSKGKIVFTTSGMAEMVDYPIKKLVSGMNIKQLIAQPFGELHERWMKHRSVKIPPGSCRGNHTVLLVDAAGTHIPVKCEITDQVVDEKPYILVTFQASSIDEGVSQQKLRLKLDDDRSGVIHEGQEDSCMGPFGQSLNDYTSRHISTFIDAFRAARQKEGGTIASCTKMLDDMIAIARIKPGVTFKLGIHPPLDESKFSPAQANERSPDAQGKVDMRVIEKSLLDRQTKPCLLRVDVVNHGHGDDATEEIFLEIFDCAGVEGILEINRSGTIVKASTNPMHMPGRIFGYMSRSMAGKSIRKFIGLPKGQILKSLMASSSKAKKGTKSTLKNSFEAKVGPIPHLPSP